ncbi:MAG: GNAT family N-acetyltransferase [Saprospiraceae bacterium]|nr:GNAT family N-acetyltransferase [Saprospiraceae bacterium]
MITFKQLNKNEFDDFFNVIVLDHANHLFKSSGQDLGFCYGLSKYKINELLNQEINGIEHFKQKILDNKTVVGYLWYAMQQVTANLKSTLYYIYIHKEFRNKHYGKLVMELFEKEMRSCDVNEISLFVFADNKIAQNLYTNLGYFVVGYDMKKDL